MRILFAGGGTGGHLYPAIAIAEEVLKKKPSSSIAFVGTRGKIEARVVPEKGYTFYPIWISGFSRRVRFSNILFPLKVVVALIQSFFVIRKMKPDVVVGTGGYVCGPVLFVASLLDIATVIHESNSYPGITTRLLASRVSNVFISFAITKQWLSSTASIELTGNPTRAALSETSRSEGSSFFNFDPEKKTIFVFGGSLGAASINEAMPMFVSTAIEQDVQLIWQTGEVDRTPEHSMPNHPNIKVLNFIDRMDCAYAAADIVVSRSGATTLAELTRLGIPAVLVPYPFAAANHQELNAQVLVDSGAAIMVQDVELKERLISEVFKLLFDTTRLNEMRKNSLALGKPLAGEQIAERIIGLKS